MAINSLNGAARIGDIADLWAQKIQANKEAKAGDPTVTVTADGKIRVNNVSAMKVGQAEETEPTDNDDNYTRQIKELQRQLKRIMAQMERVRASNASAEQKATQLQALNARAMQVMGMIQQVMAEQIKALTKTSGGASVTTA